MLKRLWDHREHCASTDHSPAASSSSVVLRSLHRARTHGRTRPRAYINYLSARFDRTLPRYVPSAGKFYSRNKSRSPRDRADPRLPFASAETRRVSRSDSPRDPVIFHARPCVERLVSHRSNPRARRPSRRCGIDECVVNRTVHLLRRTKGPVLRSS